MICDITHTPKACISAIAIKTLVWLMRPRSSPKIHTLVIGTPSLNMDVTCSTSEGLLRGWKLFLVFPPLCITSLLTALESSAVSTMLPSINDHSQAKDRFVWLMNGYFISLYVFFPIWGAALAN